MLQSLTNPVPKEEKEKLSTGKMYKSLAIPTKEPLVRGWGFAFALNCCLAFPVDSSPRPITPQRPHRGTGQCPRLTVGVKSEHSAVGLSCQGIGTTDPQRIPRTKGGYRGGVGGRRESHITEDQRARECSSTHQADCACEMGNVFELDPSAVSGSADSSRVCQQTKAISRDLPRRGNRHLHRYPSGPREGDGKHSHFMETELFILSE